jgi:metal-sulfur cluster biosynthetic enzyme
MSQEESLPLEQNGELEEKQVRESLRQVIDPETGVNIVDLGLVYDVEILNGHVRVVMTLTSPACPLNAWFSEKVKSVVESSFPNVQSADVVLVWDPPWSPDSMSQEARRQLGG